MSEWASILDFIRAKFTIHTRINSATMFLRFSQTILLSGLLLVSSTVGMPSVEFRDFSHKGPDYVALENLRFAAKDVDYLGSAQVEVLGKTYEASKYRVSVTVNVEISDAIGLVNTSVYEKHPANFDVFVVQDKSRAIHDALVEEMYGAWSNNKLFGRDYFFYFDSSGGQYLLSAIPDLEEVKLFYVTWVNGRAVKVCFVGDKAPGWGTMESFTSDLFRIRVGGSLLRAYQSPYIVNKGFVKLYEQGFFSSGKSK